VATIHQPSSATYQLFSKLMLLANGSTMYFGKPEGAIAYFEGHGFALPFAQNPADYFLNIINVRSFLLIVSVIFCWIEI
jgi:ABC-type multidrug transport system ATPase subunit